MVEALKREMGRPDTHVFRFVYVKGGENGEWTEHEFQPMFQRLDCFSVTKSFTATAVGIAQDEGYLSVDDPISRFFEEEWPADADEKLARVKVRHLLTHTMGLAEGFLFDHQRYVSPERDWLRQALAAPLPYEPGTRFVYSNSTIYLLSRIIRKATGQRTEEYLQEKLMNPFGVGEIAWEHDPDGETFGAAGLFMSARDMAKLGLLYLGGGVYGGKRILSADWVREATRPQITETGGEYYGYGFWLYPGIGFAATGAYSQVILAMPEDNAVLAAHAYNTEGFDYPEMIRRIKASEIR